MMDKENLKEILIKIKLKRTSINLQFNSIQKTLKDLENWIEIMESNL